MSAISGSRFLNRLGCLVCLEVLAVMPCSGFRLWGRWAGRDMAQQANRRIADERRKKNSSQTFDLLGSMRARVTKLSCLTYDEVVNANKTGQRKADCTHICDDL